MHYALTIAGLAALAAAAPIKQAGDNWYVSYVPYAGYNPYSGAVEAEAAKMNMALDDAKMAMGMNISSIPLASL